jgi:hypothetical protein
MQLLCQTLLLQISHFKEESPGRIHAGTNGCALANARCSEMNSAAAFAEC